MPDPPISERGVWIAWMDRGYWLREEDERILLYNANGRKNPSFQLCGIGTTPTCDFAAFSLRTGKRMPGVFHRYMVQQKGPHRFPKVPRWYSPASYRD
jgi:hypothetical protein